MTDASSATPHRPLAGLDAGADGAALARFLTARGDAARPPERGEVARHLAALTEERGWDAAQVEWWALQHAAARRWGAGPAAILGAVLRDARCTAKPARLDEWQRAERAIAGLPEAWRAPFAERLAASRDRGQRARGVVLWSAARLEAVATALRRWALFCREAGHPTTPTGVAFDAYADALTARKPPCTARTVADYLGRIRNGFSEVLDPGAALEGARFVADEWDRRGRLAGPTTKSAAGVVPASRIYTLGLDLMERARRRPVWGTRAALDMRNGVLLATAACLPQRARALAALDLATTFRPQEHPLIEVNLPGRVLKMRERRKGHEGFHRMLENGVLWEALDEYRRVYRPIFDAGTGLFPSMHAQGVGVSQAQLGRLAGSLTERHLGKRVSIHRVRDCVATETTERMPNGAWHAPRLLDHRDAATTRAHYVHAEGLEATLELASYCATRQGGRVDLDL